jgi:hypothetical protein
MYLKIQRRETRASERRLHPAVEKVSGLVPPEVDARKLLQAR